MRSCSRSPRSFSRAADGAAADAPRPGPRLPPPPPRHARLRRVNEALSRWDEHDAAAEMPVALRPVAPRPSCWLARLPNLDTLPPRWDDAAEGGDADGAPRESPEPPAVRGGRGHGRPRAAGGVRAAAGAGAAAA